LKNLEDGSIKISLFRLIYTNQDIFLELLKNFEGQFSPKLYDKNGDIKSKMKKVLSYRLHEVNNFIEFYELVREFYQKYLTESNMSKKLSYFLILKILSLI